MPRQCPVHTPTKREVTFSPPEGPANNRTVQSACDAEVSDWVIASALRFLVQSILNELSDQPVTLSP